jgi:rRNA maturation RNase YbeY
VKRRENRIRAGQVGYPSKKNHGVEPVNPRTFCPAGEASGPLTRHRECVGDKQPRVAFSQPAFPRKRQSHGRIVVSIAAAGTASNKTVAGELAISADIARENAIRLGHSVAEETRILVLHGILHLAGFDHEHDNGEMAHEETRLRQLLKLEMGLIERTETRASQHLSRKSRIRRVPRKAHNRMNWAVALALVPLLGLLALASYVDRVYQEIGKFLSREFQDNIDVFEQKVEPILHVSRARASLSMSVLKQLTTATISLLVGFALFSDQRWSIYEILQAAISLVVIIIVFNQFLPFVFLAHQRRLAYPLDVAGANPDLSRAAGDYRAGVSCNRWHHSLAKIHARNRRARPRPWTR